MKILKFFVVVLSLFGLCTFSYGYLSKHEVFSTIKELYNRTPSTLVNNKYYMYDKNVNTDFIRVTDDFIVNNKDEIINIYYTIIASGMNNFTFFCDKNYSNCIKDVLSLNDDTILLSQMNNFVSVYNSFKSIKTTYTNNGKITLSIDRVYSDSDINRINNEIDNIYIKIVISNDMKENIKSAHDYIINNTKYNVNDEKTSIPTDSSTAIGVFFNGLATCNGYTDAMALLLDKMNISNVRISNDSHIWNLVKIDDKWLHLDLTWDDPINNLNQDLLVYDYYLLNNDELLKADKDLEENDHLFDKEIYNFVS